MAEGVERIARAFHDEYEAWAAASGWETQEATRTGFDDLPAENRATMLATVQSLVDRKIVLSASDLAQARNQERELERELEELRAQGAATADAITRAEEILTGFDPEELEKLGLTVPDEISNAGIVLTEALGALRSIEPGIVDRAVHQERQRIQEALGKSVAERFTYLAEHSSAPTAWHAALQEFNQLLEELPTLDTLDPPGEGKLPAPQTDNLPAECDGSGQFEAFMGEQAVRVDCGGFSRCHPSGEDRSGTSAHDRIGDLENALEVLLERARSFPRGIGPFTDEMKAEHARLAGAIKGAEFVLAHTRPVDPSGEEKRQVEKRAEGYVQSPLAKRVIEQLEAREAEAKDALEKWKAEHPGRHDSPSALVSYTEKRIYRDSILTVADTDLELHLFPPSGEQGEEDWPEAKTHELKCWAPYFGEVLSGRKNFEVRREDDRHFEEGDLLKLRETDPHTDAYTGRECERRITYKFGFPTVNEAFGLRPDVVVLALAPATSRYVPATDSSKEEQRDDFHLCFNCGGITPASRWTYWQPDPEHKHGEADYRPHGLPGDSDALAKCPHCDELHGDGYVGAGYEDGTRAEVVAEKRRLLAKDPEFFVGASSKEVGGDGE